MSENCNSNDKVRIEMIMMKDEEIMVEEVVPLVLLLPLPLLIFQPLLGSQSTRFHFSGLVDITTPSLTTGFH